MKVSFWRKVFVYSFLIYFTSTFYTKFVESDLSFRKYGYLKILYSLPLDFMHLNSKDHISTQIGILSSLEVAEILKTDPIEFPNCFAGNKHTFSDSLSLQDKYVVLRVQNYGNTSWGIIKCYFSSQPFPVSLYVFLYGRMPTYYDVIFPYPENIDKHSRDLETISLRWKNSWGSP